MRGARDDGELSVWQRAVQLERVLERHEVVVGRHDQGWAGDGAQLTRLEPGFICGCGQFGDHYAEVLASVGRYFGVRLCERCGRLFVGGRTQDRATWVERRTDHHKSLD